MQESSSLPELDIQLDIACVYDVGNSPSRFEEVINTPIDCSIGPRIKGLTLGALSILERLI
jgi:hypothetical protein